MLTDQDRESLAWTIYGGGPSREEFAASIEATVEAIIARHVEAALNAAAERCELTDDIRECIAIVRTAANSPP